MIYYSSIKFKSKYSKQIIKFMFLKMKINESSTLFRINI